MIIAPLDNNEDADDESPPSLLLPQVTTDPSVFNAAKAVGLEYITDTPLVSEDDTDDESPP